MNRLTAAALLLGALTAPPAIADEGADLHQKHCVSCHGSEVYTRADRRVTTLNGLKKQVRRCELSLGLGWFDEQIDRVADHLNRTHYHFE